MHAHGQIVAGFQVGQLMARPCNPRGSTQGGGINGSHPSFPAAGHTALVLSITAGPTEGIQGAL